MFVFLYIETRVNEIKNPDILATPSLFYFFQAAIKEAVYVLLRLVGLLIYRKDLSLNTDIASDTAIILIHGFGRNQMDWYWMRHIFKGAPLYTVTLHPAYGTLQQLASNLNECINKKINSEAKYKKLYLVGHSMGGLVASYFAEHLDTANLTKKIITLGSPFYGTKLAVIGVGANLEQMQPETKFLIQLRHDIANSSIEYYQVASKFDNIIYPWQSAITQGLAPDKQLILDYVTHLGLMHSKAVHQQVLQWLNLTD